MSVFCRAEVMYMCMSRNLRFKLETFALTKTSCWFHIFIAPPLCPNHCCHCHHYYHHFHLSIAPPCSACSISNWESNETNLTTKSYCFCDLHDFDFGRPLDLIFRGKVYHSKLRCSLLIQKKSTFRKFITFVSKPFQTIFKRWRNSPLRLSPNRWQRRDTNVSRGW